MKSSSFSISWLHCPILSSTSPGPASTFQKPDWTAKCTQFYSIKFSGLQSRQNVHKKPTTVENPVDGQYDQVELARLSACLSASFQPTDSPQSSTQMNGDQRSVEGANIEALEEEQSTHCPPTAHCSALKRCDRALENGDQRAIEGDTIVGLEEEDEPATGEMKTDN